MDPLRKALVGVTVVGLAVDTLIHLKVARFYDPVAAAVSEGTLFRIEAVVAAVAAVLLLVRPRRLTAAFAALVAGGGVLALLLTYFVHAGQIGPLPDMYEPVWFAEKVIALVAQSIAAVTAVALVVLDPRRERDVAVPAKAYGVVDSRG